MVRVPLVSVILLAGPCGCAPNRVPPDAFGQVMPGTTRPEVEQLLGAGAAVPGGPHPLAGRAVPADAEWVRWSDDWSWEGRRLDVAFAGGRVVWREARSETPNPVLAGRVVGVLFGFLLVIVLFIWLAVYRKVRRFRAVPPAASTPGPPSG